MIKILLVYKKCKLKMMEMNKIMLGLIIIITGQVIYWLIMMDIRRNIIGIIVLEVVKIHLSKQQQ